MAGDGLAVRPASRPTSAVAKAEVARLRAENENLRVSNLRLRAATSLARPQTPTVARQLPAEGADGLSIAEQLARHTKRGAELLKDRQGILKENAQLAAQLRARAANSDAATWGTETETRLQHDDLSRLLPMLEEGDELLAERERLREERRELVGDLEELLPMLVDRDALRAEREELEAERKELLAMLPPDAEGVGDAELPAQEAGDEEDLGARLRAAVGDAARENASLEVEISGLRGEGEQLRSWLDADAAACRDAELARLRSENAQLREMLAAKTTPRQAAVATPA